MRLSFIKMEGLGNDYVYLDCMKRDFVPTAEEIVRLSDRHTGVGGDGVVLIRRGDAEPVRMTMFNSDGSEGAMCGNAIRCVAYYARSRGYVSSDEFRIETKSGVKKLAIRSMEKRGATVTVGMGAATGFSRAELAIGGEEREVWCLSMGNPHCVQFVDDPDWDGFASLGPLTENHPFFPDRTNAEFARVTGDNEVYMRVWERGAGETMACGTGACATAVAAARTGRADGKRPVKVRMKGGVLTIGTDGAEVEMTGAAREVFTGEIEL